MAFPATPPDRYKIKSMNPDGSGQITWGMFVLLYHAQRADPKDPDWTLIQGCKNGSVGASAGTHSGCDVGDTSAFNAEKRLRILKNLGAFGWIRGPKSYDTFDPHIHWGIKNSKKMDPSANRQRTSYRLGKNGLVSNLDDRHPYRSDAIFQYRKFYHEMVRLENLDAAERVLQKAVRAKRRNRYYEALVRFTARYRAKPKSNN